MSPKMTQGLGKWRTWMKKALTASHACMLSYFSRVRLCDPMDCSLSGSSVHGILQARIFWSGLPCPLPGDLPDPGIKPKSRTSPALAGRFFTTKATREVPDCIPGNIISFPLQTQGEESTLASLSRNGLRYL